MASTCRAAAQRAAVDVFKRRGYLFPSAAIYSGLRGAYDLGPLALELKKNIERHWWRSVVHAHPEIKGFESPILTPAAVLKASGHVANFADLLVDDRLSGARFRADKAAPLETKPAADGQEGCIVPLTAPDRPTAEAWAHTIREVLAPGARVERKAQTVLVHVRHLTEPQVSEMTPEGLYDAVGYMDLVPEDPTTADPAALRVEYHGYVNPANNNPFLTAPRPFNLLFKSFADTRDPVDQIIDVTMRADTTSNATTIRAAVDQTLDATTVYLRPETAQGVYAAFPHMVKTLNLVPPFGIAQAGKSFRNEIRPEHFLFRGLEFEQLELQYFVAPWDAPVAHLQWRDKRFGWWQTLAAHPDEFRLREHEPKELAHYADGCYDVEYLFPWGWGELEGVANRTDYDLQCHARASGASFTVHDRTMPKEPETPGGPQQKYTPYVIESSAGLSRAVLAFLYDAFDQVAPSGAVSVGSAPAKENSGRGVMRLHPSLAPTTVHVLPIVGNNPDLTRIAHDVYEALMAPSRSGFGPLITAQVETRGTVGKRYQQADEVGVPVCVTVDQQSLTDHMVTVRHRDTMEQRRVPVAEIGPRIVEMLSSWERSYER
ncbi:hypothetical protein AMAG_10121 [Allomyces macrogynus ATCC 38327]|uniref:Aminoacyl-transfer RNA synthetases class-II family profile domain-containing protein n=1 Tax=Allomyces macrogynus (strain ATCC 38327) TaxID=578462 RepID=A0A0L0SQX4_ALLM3|nr:hypothetical protein AMAG_10121 [Allomyces macrogynus ATCC 38327]|eukprot:KNE64779.1 hypothetical protein AMAG_10121 [Allomyces macrogynus ATCC 38327]